MDDRILRIKYRTTLSARLWSWIAIHFFTSLYLFALTPVSAYAESSAPSKTFLDALWVAQSTQLSKFHINDSSSALQIFNSYRVVAIDADRAVLWGYGQGELHQLDFEGNRLGTRKIDDENGVIVELVVDRKNGSVWAAIGKSLYHISAKMELLSTVDLESKIVAADFDSSHGLFWLAMDSIIVARDASGQILNTFKINTSDQLSALTVDQASGDLWVATRNAIRRYSASGNLMQQWPLGDVVYMSTDAEGVWAASDKQIYRIDRISEQILFEIYPYSGQGSQNAFATDPRRQSIWAAQNNELIQVNIYGEIQNRITTPSPVRHLAVYADLLPPTIKFIEPQLDSYINVGVPDISLSAGDPHIGINLATLEIKSSDAILQSSCEFIEDLILCAPNSALSEGDVSLSATIEDYAGNISQPASTHFTIDTIAPEITVYSPTDGSITNNPETALMGVLSEYAMLVINGQSVPIGINNSFSHGPLRMTERVNIFTLAATDYAGNISTSHLNITLDTVSPIVTPPPDIAQEAAGPITPVLLGSALAVDNVSGNLIPTADNVGPYPVGIHTVIWSATDQAGNIGVAKQTITIKDTTPPVVSAPADIVVEANGQLSEVDLGKATASDLVDGALSPLPNPGGPYLLGDHEIIWSVTDEAGNIGYASQQLTVRDTMPPTLQAPQDIVVENATPIPIDLGEPVTQDLFPPITVSNDAPDIFPLGETMVTWSARDANGNISTATQIVAILVTTQTPGWGEAGPIEAEDGNAFSPRVATDSIGNVVAVWYQYTSGANRIWANQYSKSGGWDSAVRLSTGNGQADSPHIAINAKGDAVAVWRQLHEGHYRIFASLWQVGQWSAPTVISSQDASPIAPRAAINANGNIFVIWSQFDGIASSAWVNRFLPGQGWQVDQMIESFSWPVGSVRIGIDDTGNAIAAWLQSDGVAASVFVNRFEPASGWSGPQTMDINDEPVSYVELAMHSGGKAMILWLQGSSHAKLYGSYFTTTGGWTEQSQVLLDSTAKPQLSINNKGQAAASSGTGDIFVNLFEPEDGWGARQSVKGESSPARDPVIGIDDFGNVIAVWAQGYFTKHVYANRYRPGQGWGGAKLIEKSDRYAATPHLAINGRGNAVVVWRQLQPTSNSRFDIWANQYDVGGDAIGAPQVTPPPDIAVEATQLLMPVELGEATVTDDIDSGLTATPSRTGPFALGIHSVVWSATDSDGHIGAATQKVTVQDTKPPILIPPPDLHMDAPGSMEIGVPIAFDLFGPVNIVNDAPDSFPAGVTKVVWSATDSNGNTAIAEQYIAVARPLQITIDTPTAGTYVEGESVIVSGTVVGPSNVGVMINTTPATLVGGPYGATYHAEVPLRQGENTLIAIASAPDGTKTNVQIDIQADVNVPVSIDLHQNSQVEPSLMTLSTEGGGDLEITKLEVDTDGDGIFELSNSTDPALGVQRQFTTPGAHIVTVRATFNDGTLYTTQKLIAVRNGIEVDRELTEIWDGMNRALLSGSVTYALQYLDRGAQEKYGPVFTALLPHFPEIVSSYSHLQRYQVHSDIAEYAINRWDGDIYRLFLINFIRDHHGIWRIVSM